MIRILGVVYAYDFTINLYQNTALHHLINTAIWSCDCDFHASILGPEIEAYIKLIIVNLRKNAFTFP